MSSILAALYARLQRNSVAVLAGLSPVLYHATNCQAAASIFVKNRFELKPAEGTDAETHIKGHGYYLSCSRIKNAAYTVKSMSDNSVVLVLDGVRLGQRFKGSAIDYWGPDYYKTPDTHAKRFESEDRVFASTPFIAPAVKYIKAVHVRINTSREPLMFAIKKACLLNRIPCWWYTNNADLLLQDTRKAVKYSPSSKTIVEPPNARSYRAYNMVNSISPWLALWEAPRNANLDGWRQADVMGEPVAAVFKHLGYNDAVSVLNAAMHNAKTARYDDLNGERKALDRLVEVLRKNKLDTRQFCAALKKKWYVPMLDKQV